MQKVSSHLLLLAAHGAIAGLASLLIQSALIRLAPRRCLGQGLIHLAPTLCAAVGVYLFAGASQAATLLGAAAVGAMLFANGFAIMSHVIHDEPMDTPSPLSLVLPLAAILLLSGFASVFTPASLIGLALVGILGADLAASQRIAIHEEPRRYAPLAAVAALVAAGVVVASAHQFTSEAAQTLMRITPDTFLVCVLAPATLLPLIGHATRDAANGRLEDTLGVTATFVVLAMGICLPLLVGVDYLVRRPHDEFARTIALPAVTWRLDTPLLLAGGFAMLGVRVGLVKLHRWVGLLMVTLYGAYLLLATMLRIG